MKKTIKKIERKSSLESEPRTLSLDQIQCARDAALFVVKNKSFEDAIRIFTEPMTETIRPPPAPLKKVKSLRKVENPTIVLEHTSNFLPS
ncbi:hypothetical protein QJS04_geneDACA009015 [Acorus gramineus]|uniref:Dynein light chain n=1 Tax=Acorus gramineus TaxID=55184 RepID=A0AAV9ARL3_ACOGR|nr:hypothetical protein QJS04_geneDACA009015 [Acorus gramineus]